MGTQIAQEEPTLPAQATQSMSFVSFGVIANQRGQVGFSREHVAAQNYRNRGKEKRMSGNKPNNPTAMPATHSLNHVHRESVSFGEPAMFWLDESLLQEYLRLERERLNTKRAPSSF